MFPRIRIAIFMTGLLMTAALPAQAERLDKTGRAALVGHKALYDIEMTSKRSSSQVLNIHGQMYFALQPSCDAWTTDHRFNLYYEYADSPPMQITSNFTTYEPMDGKSFSFNSRRKRNGELYQELRGAAVRSDDGSSHATYSLPEGLTFDIKMGGLFPMAHTAAMMQHIKDGHKIFNAVVFDGSDEEGPIEVNTLIGKPVPPTAIPTHSAIDKTLVSAPARYVRMAFFPLADDSPTSDYEMDVALHDNGIISSMKVDYGEFAVSQRLRALEKMPPPNCGNSIPTKTEKRGDLESDEPPAVKPRKKLFGLIP